MTTESKNDASSTSNKPKYVPLHRRRGDTNSVGSFQNVGIVKRKLKTPVKYKQGSTPIIMRTRAKLASVNINNDSSK